MDLLHRSVRSSIMTSTKIISSICIILSYFEMTSCASHRRIGVVKENTYLAIPAAMYPPADSIVSTHNEWTRANYPKMIKAFKADPLKLHDIVFLGNSITRQGGDWDERLGNEAIKNRGIAGDVTDGVMARLGEILYVKPTAVFIEIGINDLYNPILDPERTAKNINRIAERIKQQSPGTSIFVQTVFPTSHIFLRSKISETNKILSQLQKPKVYTLIETHKLFADSADLMRKEYTKDGVHLTEKGYQVWVDHLRKFFK